MQNFGAKNNPVVLLCRSVVWLGRKITAGYYSSAPQIKNTVFPVFSVFPVSAARSGMANLSSYAEFWCKE